MKNLLFPFLIILNISLCSQNKWNIKMNSMNFAVLISDYKTYNFEKGNLSVYTPMDTIVNKLPVESKFEAPVDFGSITFLYPKNNDTLFSAGIVWQGQEKIHLPDNFLPADSFLISQTNIQAPLSFEYFFNSIPLLDTASYKIKADSAWDEIKSLDIVNEFAKYEYRVGIYLYTPGESVPTQNGFSNTVGAKWIVFLYYDKSTITAVEYSKQLQDKFILMQNYPNPFNPTTTINYSIPKAGFVTLKVYDILGNEVAILVNEEKSTGNYSVQLSAGSGQLASGVYFYRMQVYTPGRAGNFIETKKLILLK